MLTSALDNRLDDSQRKELLDYAIRRAQDLRSAREQDAFSDRRMRAESELEGMFHHRLSSEPEERRTIYDTENVSAQLVRSVHRFLLARLAKDFFGSEPWLSAQPEGPLDGSIAAKVEKHVSWKLRASNWKASAKEALGVALTMGEVAIKTTYRVDEDTSERVAMILCEREVRGMRASGAGAEAEGMPVPDAAGRGATAPAPASVGGRAGLNSHSDSDSDSDAKGWTPVVTRDGEYVFDTDESSEVLEPGAGGVPLQTIRFAKDPSIALTAEMKWCEHAIEETVRTYANVDMRPVYWKDVVWPLNAPSMEEADFIAHTYDSTPEELLARFDPEGDHARVQEVVQRLRAQGSEAKSEGAQPMEAKGEGALPCSYSYEDSRIKITECYFKRDVMGRGRESRVFAVIAEDAQELVWLDYVAAISPRAQWPIHLVPFNRVSGRGYGRGLFEIYEMASDLVDRQISAIVARNQQNANPTKIWNPHLTQEGEEDEDLKFAPGQTYTAKDGSTSPAEILSFIAMPDLDSRTWQLVEFFMQLIQVESGVTNATQGEVSSLPTNTTATGINSMLESSSVLHSFSLEELRDALEPALRYAVELVYFRQEADETFEYFEGDAAEVLSLADATVLRRFPINVRILLQRAKRLEMRQAALDCIPHVQAFFSLLQSDPKAAKRMRPLYVQTLRGFDIDNVDDILPSADEIDADAAAAASAAAGAGAAGAGGGGLMGADGGGGGMGMPNPMGSGMPGIAGMPGMPSGGAAAGAVMPPPGMAGGGLSEA